MLIDKVTQPFKMIPEIKVIKFKRFKDARGYFTETYRKSDLEETLGFEIVQANESVSSPWVVRGMHFQWNPYMGKLVRVIHGHMLDLILDIRKGSPSFGCMVAYDMLSSDYADYNEWIWVPPGFAHGNMFTDETRIEYFCSGEYSKGNEACISPFAKDINFDLFDLELRVKYFEKFRESGFLQITDKDRDGYTVSDWSEKEESNNFIYEELK